MGKMKQRGRKKKITMASHHSTLTWSEGKLGPHIPRRCSRNEGIFGSKMLFQFFFSIQLLNCLQEVGVPLYRQNKTPHLIILKATKEK